MTRVHAPTSGVLNAAVLRTGIASFVSSTSQNPTSLVSAAVAALRSGDPARARKLFEEVIATGQVDGAVWLGQARACRAQGDDAAKLAALDAALALNPRDLRALVMKADHYAQAGDARAAASFYRAMVNIAPPADQLTPDLVRELARARALLSVAEIGRAHV